MSTRKCSWNSSWMIFWSLLLLSHVDADDRIEPFCVVNGRGVLNRVSERFLSVSVDPGVLLAGMNLSEPSLILARHLSPSYIRLAGPTTDLVRYNDVNVPAGRDHVQVTPSMWFGINEWLALTGLTPVFGIAWAPDGVDRLLEISDKLNVSCYWQLGYDTAGRTAPQYENDMIRFQRLVSAHEDRKDWRIVGSDISTFQDIHLDYLKGIVEAFMWEPSNPESREPRRSGVKMWTSLPKSPGPVTFSTALSFAKEVGRVAKMGYEVVFRQPRMFELFSDTPVYWFSFLHKRLMGVNVLEAKFLRNVPKVEVFAHCSRRRKISSKNGVLTVMIINENDYVYGTRIVTNVRTAEKNVKVQEYILTSNGLNSTDVFLNGQLLSPDSFDSKILPKLSLTKPTLPIPVALPPHSIGFFVISGAKLNVCLNEISESHGAPEGDVLFKNIGVNIDSRSLFGKSTALDDIAERLRQEMYVDVEYYSDPKVNSRIKPKPMAKNAGNAINAFNDKAKLQRRRVEYQKRRNELKGKLTQMRSAGSELNTLFDLQPEGRSQTDKVLIRKPREINLNMLEARFGPLNKTRTTRGINRRLLDSRSKLEESRLRSVNKFRDRLKARTRSRSKRDINLDLLKVKADKKPSRRYKYQEKEATIRKPGQTSEELLAELAKEMASPEEPTPPIKTEVLAELARPSDEDSDEENFERRPNKHSHRNRDERKRKKKKKEEEELQFLTSSQEFSDIEEGLPCIHEYFGDTLHSNKDSRKGRHFLREFGEFMSEEKQEGKKDKKKDKKQVSKEDLSEEDMDEFFRRKRSTEEFSLGDLLYPRDPVEYAIDDDLSVEPLTGLKGQEILKEEHIALENLKDVGEEGIKLTQPILEDLTDSWLPHVNLDLAHTAPRDEVTDVLKGGSSTVSSPAIAEEETTMSGNEGTEANLGKDKGKEVPKMGSRSLFDLEAETEENKAKQNSEEPSIIGLRNSVVLGTETEVTENPGQDKESPKIGLRSSVDLETETDRTQVPENNPSKDQESPKIDSRGSIDPGEKTETTEQDPGEESKLGLRHSIDSETTTEGTNSKTTVSRTLQVTEETPGGDKGKETPKIGLRSLSDPETETETNEVPSTIPENDESSATPKINLRSSSDFETTTETAEEGKESIEDTEVPKIDLRGSFDPETERVLIESTESPTTQPTTEIPEITTNGKITERTTGVAPILRLRLLGSDESHELDPRHKRDKLHTTEKTSGGSYHDDIKGRLRELKEKLRFDPERKRNRLGILQSKHKQDAPEVQPRSQRTQPEESDKVNDFFEQLQLIRERLQRRKNEIDSMLAASTKRDAEVFSKLSKDLLRSRRSVRLQPLSLSLRPKTWHPADVLSLKRDAFLGSSGLPQRAPPNDYYAFRSLRDRYGSRRSKRSDDLSGNELDAKFPDKREEQNVIMKGTGVPEGRGTPAPGRRGNVLGNLDGFLGNVTAFFRDISRELRDYAKQLGILD